jgi:hypothetical protein
MIRTKTNLILNLMPLALMVFMFGAGVSTDDSFINSLKEKLLQYNKDFFVEKTYLMTDRYVYRPGEHIWFKGFVTSSGKKEQPSHSEDYFIKLLNSNGEEIVNRRYPLVHNQISSGMLIPRSSIPGRYWLVAYTGWMKNRCSQEAFRKEILISKYFEKRFQVEVTFDKVVYDPFDTLNAAIRILDLAGKPITETAFDYTLGSFAKTITKGNSKTDIMGKSTISCLFPNDEEMLMLTIAIRNRKLSGDYTIIIPSLTGNPDITFFPEGGSIVLGLKSTMAFSAINHSRLPAIIMGEITDRLGNVLQLVHTDTTGKGSFEYMPAMDTNYLRITKPAGISKKYPLPIANQHGIVIHLVETNADSAKISIASSDDQSLTATHWLAVMNKQVVWSSVVNFTKSTLISIPIRNLRSGILQLSVFDNNHILAAERLININNMSKPLGVKTDHRVYHSRQRVNILLECPENLTGVNLALSVSQRGLTYNSQSSDFVSVINSNLCNNHSIYIQNPGLTRNLDLMTTLYRDIYWVDVLSNNEYKKPYVHYDGLFGKVLDKKENLSQHAKVRVTHIPNFRSFETQSDENGNFQVVFGSEIIDYKYLNIDAYDPPGKVSLTTIINQSYAEELSNSLIEESKNHEQQKIADILSYGEPDLVYALRYGPGKFRKTAKETRKKYDPNQYANYTDVLDIIQDIKPYQLTNNKLIFADDYNNNLNASHIDRAIIVINGLLKGDDAAVLKNLLPSDITNINISTSLLDVHKYTLMNFGGVIEITTIQGMYRYRQPHMQIGPNIFNAELEFYSPDYSVESTTSADNRKTLYWNPAILLNPGRSMLVNFYTSDVKGIFYGHLVGIDENGNPIESEFSFAVE